MVRNGVIVQLAKGALLGPYAAGEVAEVIHREREIRKIGFADGLAVVVGLNRGQKGQVFFDSVRDTIKYAGALGDGSASPLVSGGMRRIESKLYVFDLRAGDLADNLSG